MSSPPTTRPPDERSEATPALPPLEPGDRLDQPTFHARYLAMPEGTRAELIGGVVHMPSPTKRPHGRTHGRVIKWLGVYEDATPGTEMYDNTSNLLGPENEPQPDACLLIAPHRGGQTSEKEEWIVGAPELIVEVASSTESIDLHGKYADYQRCGVREYVVVALRQKKVFWFVARDEEFVELAASPDGVLRSEVFPGLWLDPAALLSGDQPRVRAILEVGLASAEHAAFVAQLAARA
jgi:Uma2 family endonuclease